MIGPYVELVIIKQLLFLPKLLRSSICCQAQRSKCDTRGGAATNQLDLKMGLSYETGQF